MHLTYDRTSNLFEDLIYLIELEFVENVMGCCRREKQDGEERFLTVLIRLRK